MNRESDPVREAARYIGDNKAKVRHFLHRLMALNRQLMLRSDVLDLFLELNEGELQKGLSDTPFAALISWCQEVVIHDCWVCFA